MTPSQIRTVFRRARGLSLQRGYWATATRNGPAVVDGVECNANVLFNVWERPSSTRERVDGECLVYLSWNDGESVVGECGWLRFGASSGIEDRCELIHACAMREAEARLKGRPEFQARVQRARLLDDTPQAAETAPRARSGL